MALRLISQHTTYYYAKATFHELTLNLTNLYRFVYWQTRDKIEHLKSNIRDVIVEIRPHTQEKRHDNWYDQMRYCETSQLYEWNNIPFPTGRIVRYIKKKSKFQTVVVFLHVFKFKFLNGPPFIYVSVRQSSCCKASVAMRYHNRADGGRLYPPVAGNLFYRVCSLIFLILLRKWKWCS